MGVPPLNLSLWRENTSVSGGVGVDPVNLYLGRNNATVSGGMAAGEEGEGRNLGRVGEDHMRALSIDKLHAIANLNKILLFSW